MTTNVPFANMIGSFQGLLNKPTLDRTGLKGAYDIKLRWPINSPSATETFKQALLDQFGVEVVPGSEAIEMLVVEQVKK